MLLTIDLKPEMVSTQTSVVDRRSVMLVLASHVKAPAAKEVIIKMGKHRLAM